MVDLAAKLYASATPESFDSACKGRNYELEVTGDRHACTTPEGTRVVHFIGDKASEVTVIKKGIRKGALDQVKRKHGKPDSVKTQGALKMHFWFTEKASVAVAFQSSTKSRSTMVSFRSPT